MKTYESMKPSNVLWLGSIPEHWTMRRNITLLTERDERSEKGEEQLLSLSQYTGITIRGKNSTKMGMHEAESLVGYKVVHENDIVMNIMLAWNGSTAKSKFEGIISPAYAVYHLIDNSANPDYLHYLYKTPYFMQYFEAYSTGLIKSRLRLYPQSFLHLSSIVPPREEQDQIVCFLDWKISEINKLISLRKKQIEQLRELKRTVVSHAVTRGLNPDIKMKDSGTHWIGDIPENWRLIRINNIADKEHPYSIGDGDHGLIKPSDYTDSGIPYIRVQNLGWATEIDTSKIVYISEETNQKIKNSTLRPNDVLFAKTGGTIGKTALVPESMPIANTTSHVGKITVSPQYCSKYVFYVLSSYIGYKQFWEVAAQKTTRPELTIGEIKQIVLTVPPTIEEQQDIVRYLDEQSEKINTAITNKQKQIETLKEFKTRLISDVVTGKIDVRGIEIPEYEYTAEEADTDSEAEELDEQEE